MQEQRELAFLSQHLGDMPRPMLVAIEGFMGSGKSTLADALGSELGAAVLHIDNFVVPGDESLPYDVRLDYNLLVAAFPNASFAFVEGICLRQVLARIKIVPTIFVYVKRISVNGLWHDGLHLEEYEEDIHSTTSEPEKSDLHYHASVRPHEHANIIFQRVEA